MLPGHRLEGLHCAFGTSGSLFALATPDGRIRSYDTVTGRLRSTSKAGKTLGLANGSTALGGCLAWLEAPVSAKKTVRSNGAAPSRSWVAIGTASGDVKAFDTATGELRWHCKGANDGGVACLAAAPGGVGGADALVASGADGTAATLDAATGEVRARARASKHAVTGAALSRDGAKLLLGGATLALLDAASGERLQKLAGHPAPVRAAAFAPSGAYALSAAPGERAVAVWDVSVSCGAGSKKARKLGGVAAASLVLDEPAVSLSTCAARGAGAAAPGSFCAAAVTEAGTVSVFLVTPDGGGASARLLARVRVGGGDGGGDAECVLAAFLEESDDGATLLVARGSSAKPTFERVPIALSSARSAGGAAAADIVLQPGAGGVLLLSTAAAGAAGAEPSTSTPSPLLQQQQLQQQQQQRAPPAAVLGPENAGDAVRTRVAAADAAAAAIGRKRGAPGGDDGAALMANGIGGSDDDDEGVSDDDDAVEEEGQTLGARVAALEARQERHAAANGAAAMDEDGGAAAAAADAVRAAEAAAAAAAAVVDAGEPLKADSLAVLLSQALRSGDRALLERCLAVGSERVVANTVRRLVPIDAAALLRAAVERLQSRPARGAQLAAWIRATLVSHTAYLMNSPGAQPALSALYQLIEARLAQQRALLSLSGRLDLLLAQMPAGAAGAGAGSDGDDEDGDAAGPAVRFDDCATSDEDDEEVDVEDALRAADFDSDEEEDDDEEDADGGFGGGGSGSEDDDEDMDEGEE